MNLQLTIVPTPDMPTKFATLVAGNDLPDLIEPATTLPNGLPAGIGNLPAFLAAKCQNLDEFLAGDAVNEYPFLANIPTPHWKTCVWNGSIYGSASAKGVSPEP